MGLPCKRAFNELPDFFIGAHAAVQELPVLTRDVRRMRQYFPTLALISPEASP